MIYSVFLQALNDKDLKGDRNKTTIYLVPIPVDLNIVQTSLKNIIDINSPTVEGEV